MQWYQAAVHGAFGTVTRECLAIPVKQQIPEEKRREIVQSKMTIGPSDFHREGIEQSLSALGIKAKVEEMPEKGTILVTALEIADSSMTLDQAKGGLSGTDAGTPFGRVCNRGH